MHIYSVAVCFKWTRSLGWKNECFTVLQIDRKERHWTRDYIMTQAQSHRQDTWGPKTVLWCHHITLLWIFENTAHTKKYLWLVICVKQYYINCIKTENVCCCGSFNLNFLTFFFVLQIVYLNISKLHILRKMVLLWLKHRGQIVFQKFLTMFLFSVLLDAVKLEVPEWRCCCNCFVGSVETCVYNQHHWALTNTDVLDILLLLQRHGAPFSVCVSVSPALNNNYC